MEISTYILTDNNVEINRLHICTWDMKRSKSFVEVGVDFNIKESIKEVSFIFAAPFIAQKSSVKDLFPILTVPENLQFIFNDKMKSVSRVEDEVCFGKDIVFDCQKEIRFLPLTECKTHDGHVGFSISNLSSNHSNYFRFLINTSCDSLATIQRGITKSVHIYDVRVNELRNIPEPIYNQKRKGYEICSSIKNCYVMHVVPSIYALTHSEAPFRSLRVIENEKFYAYLPGKMCFKEGEYVIAFNKQQTEDGSCSFCTEFEHERIGDQQILTALTLNLLCSLLFAVGALFVDQEAIMWYNRIPMVYYLALLLLLVLIGYEIYIASKKK